MNASYIALQDHTRIKVPKNILYKVWTHVAKVLLLASKSPPIRGTYACVWNSRNHRDGPEMKLLRSRVRDLIHKARNRIKGQATNLHLN